MRGLRIIAELEPTRNPRKLHQRVRLLVPHFDAIDIPESPMGKPIAHAAVLAALINSKYGTPVIPHIRVSDVNTVALLSLMGGLAAAEVREAVLLRGDPPEEGAPVEELTVEDAAALVKKRLRGKSPRIGAMLSIRQPMERIEARLRADIDFYMVLRALSNLEKLDRVSRLASRLDKELYAYLIVARPHRLAALKAMLGDQPVYLPEEALTVAEKIEPLVDGVIVSSPGDVEAVVETGQLLSTQL